MTAEPDEQLERVLADLTTWRGETPQLWRRALASADAGPSGGASRVVRILRRRAPIPVAAAIIVVALGITIALNLPHLGFEPGRPAATISRVLLSREKTAVQELDADTLGRLTSLGYIGSETTDVAPSSDSEDDARSGYGFVDATYPGRFGKAGMGPPGDLPPFASTNPAEIEPRHVVRKATIEFVTDDVRAAFLKASAILSEADGEYIEDSSLTGRGEDAQANLTLRVAARRLPEVLNELRELGDVHSEKVTGQDVTTQVVDLEARLRNEQRVEMELLELLEKRQNAPLKEILELRNTLTRVRGEIERLTAQRERLSRLVSLATVLVIIRAEEASPDPPAEPSIGTYFIEHVRNAWKKGLIFLADTCGLLLSVLVGGLLWWILLAAAFATFRRYRRRADVAKGES